MFGYGKEGQFHRPISEVANSKLDCFARTAASRHPCLGGAINRRPVTINSCTQTLLAVRNFPESSTLTYLDRPAALARDKEHSASRFDHVSLSGTVPSNADANQKHRKELSILAVLFPFCNGLPLYLFKWQEES
jgi:hypothetical protein